MRDHTARRRQDRRSMQFGAAHALPGREVPTPLKVRIVFGDTDLDQVLADIVALTKLNFNAYIFADGLAVTLRFVGDIGEILTAIPELSSKLLPFRHYI